MSSEPTQACAECGATIYPEHLSRHTADVWQGKLLCPYCLAEKKAGSGAGVRVAAGAGAALGPGGGAGLRRDGGAGQGEPGGVELMEVSPASAGRERPRVQTSAVAVREPSYQRKLDPEAPTATRCKTFHCKLSDAAIVHMNEQINEWVDANPEVRIKFSNSSVGVVEGKNHDPHLLVTVFY